jgi:transcriptional regulator with XRE-family HTH domain
MSDLDASSIPGAPAGQARRPRALYLCTLRRRARLSQPELARRSGISQPNISHLERREPDRVKPGTRERLAAALGVEPARLRFGPNPYVERALERRRLRWRRSR